jgi:hypothetical protein
MRLRAAINRGNRGSRALGARARLAALLNRMLDRPARMESLDAEVLARLRSAAAELLPVVVEVGPERRRLCSFVEAVLEHELVLSPIAAQALPDECAWLRITPAAGTEHWCISARTFARDAPARTRVELAGAKLESPAALAEVSGTATDLLALVVPGGLSGSDSYVFPIQRIGAHQCEIRTSVPIAPGKRLPFVEIVGDRRLLRRASAEVLETVPWVLSNGATAFGCRLGLAETDEDEPARLHDLVTDPNEVRRILVLAAAMQARGWYEAPGRGRGVLLVREIQKDHARFELVHDPVGAIELGSVRIGLELFAAQYELDVRPLAAQGRDLRTALPLILRRRLQTRRDQRVSVVAPQRVEVEFRHPVTGVSELHEVTEVSFFGLTFACNSAADALWPGLPLETADLLFAGQRIALGDLVVEDVSHEKATQGMSCAVTIPSSAIADDPAMIALLANLGHPEVRVHNGDDFEGLHETYVQAGLFGPHMHRNLAPMLEQTRRVWHALHDRASDVVRTFVHGPERAPNAAVTVMRAWEHAFLLQHFVDAAPELSGATGRLQAAYLDHVLPRPDGRYLVFFVKTDNHVMNAYLRRFFASTGTPDAVSRSTVELWIRPGDTTRAPPRRPDAAKVELRACEPGDETLLARAAQRAFGSYAAAALSLQPGELYIPDTEQRFARAGLERSRQCHVATCEGARAYAVVEERTTPGVNLTWMLNASWILPLHAAADANGAALDATLASIVAAPAQASTGERFLNLPEGFDAARLEAWGFSKEAALYLYVVTRAGLHRLFHYTAMRCGEVEALTQRRERRRALRSG